MSWTTLAAIFSPGMVSFAPTWSIFLLASIQAPLEFGSTVKNALITPAAMELGIGDIQSVLPIWISGPICEMVAPFLLGYCSKWLGNTRWGRNKPIIVIGCLVNMAGMVLMGLVWDATQIGRNNHWELSSRQFHGMRYMFVGSCWIMEISKNFIAGSMNNLMLDICQHDQARIKESGRWVIVFSTLGGIAGSAASSYSNLHKGFPFTRTRYCDASCANLKACYIVNMLLFGVTMCTLFNISQPSSSEQHEMGEDEVQVSNLTHLKQSMKKPFLYIYIAYTLAMMDLYPFEVYGSDYVGLVYGGDPESPHYMEGVRIAALGLMLLAIIVGVVSLALEPLIKAIGGLKRVWGVSTILLACTFLGSIVLKYKAEKAGSNAVSNSPPKYILFATLSFYVLMGVPNAATSLLPSLLVSTYADDVAPNPGRVKYFAVAVLKVLNLLSDILAVTLCAVFGLGNTVFILMAIAAVLSSIVIFALLPSTNT